MEEAGEAGRCATLRDVVCSGEALSRGLAAKFHELLPARLHNLYGPTEAAVDVTSWECERGGGEGASVPIGRPISNTRIYVLDAGLRLVLRGVAGELHIGGVALARGYLNRPGLTAERFIPDPYSTEPGARLYKTGDLARHRADGAVEFLGRIDNQVKLRGFRIELGEIEAVLREHDSVAEAVVVLREESPGDPRLVAYFVGEAAAEELRSHLQARLPDYMAPSAYVQLGALPLTASGKVDRRALPSHGGRRVSSGAAYAPPRTEAEQTIAALWREVLGVERVGVDDNFFDLGGHSLLLVRLVNKLRAAFTKEINVVDMFKYPTIHALADFLTLAEDEESSGEKTKDRASLRQASTRRWRQQRQQRRAAAAAQGEVDEVAD
jgi:non-ribosomal peptide synthetase component F